MLFKNSARPLLITLCLGSLSFAQTGPAPYSDRAAFASAAAADLRVMDFEGPAPDSGFTQFKKGGKLDVVGG